MNLHELNEHFQSHAETLEAYFKQEFQKTPPSFYISCDIRNSGFKAAVVDTNLFPAGFNNLCASFTRQAILQIKKYLNRLNPKLQKILLFTESHTRNKFYFENISRLSKMIDEAGYELKIATISPEITNETLNIPLANENLPLHALRRKGDKVYIAPDWEPELILSNNDFSSGLPELLIDIEQTILPSPSLGWHQRRKSSHFKIYNEVAQEIGKRIDIDPWFLSCLSTEVNEIQLSEKTGVDLLANAVAGTLKQIQEKYTQYHIQQTPYVFVKNNSGTYGMGVEYFSSAEEIREMGRRTRNKLLSSKGGNTVDSFLIQEGIVTADFYSGYPIEPVVYMVGETEIGGFFRINDQKDEWSSLNSKGMAFSCLCLHKLDEPHEGMYLNCNEKRDLVSLSFDLGKIAALAAARENIPTSSRT